MTRDDIIRMAHEADKYADRVLSPGEFHPDKHDVRDLHFAAIVAAAEREACAKVCEKLIDTFSSSQYKTGQPWSSIGERFAVSSCAAAIRARGEA